MRGGVGYVLNEPLSSFVGICMRTKRSGPEPEAKKEKHHTVFLSRHPQLQELKLPLSKLCFLKLDSFVRICVVISKHVLVACIVGFRYKHSSYWSRWPPRYIFTDLLKQGEGALRIDKLRSSLKQTAGLAMVFSLWPKESFVKTGLVTGTTSAPPSSDQAQNLGRNAGKYDIRCALEGKRSPWAPKWCIDTATSEVTGALFFSLQFQQPRDLPLQYAKVRINIGQPANAKPVPVVDTYAPKYGIVGPPLYHRREQIRNYDPQISASAGPAGVGISGISAGTNVQSVSHRKWMFTSGTPSSFDGTKTTEVEFTWTRGWDDDYDATNRVFKAALILSRASLCNLALTVKVEAKPLSRWHRTGLPKEKTSDPLQPRHNTESDKFQEELIYLEQKIREANKEMSALGKYTCADRVSFPLTR